MQDTISISVSFSFTDQKAVSVVKGAALDHAKKLMAELQPLISTALLRAVQVVMQGDDFFMRYEEMNVDGAKLIDNELGLPKGDLE
jgi:hypothetical protein